MAKRKRENNEKQIDKKTKQGRGQGQFKDYRPWITIQDVGSKGLATRIRGVKAERNHQLLSNLELSYLYLLDWSEEVVDIKEQYALDLKETIALAKEINVPHPPLTKPKAPIVLTTDFLITIKQSIGTKEIARTIKYSKDLTNKRILEKFEIERLYWNERNIDWGIVTELDFNQTLIRNIKWLYKYRIIDSLPKSIKADLMSEISDYILPKIKEKKQTLRTITKLCDENFSLTPGHSLALVRHLIANKTWIVDMLQPLQPEKILLFISTNEGGKNNGIT